jgi:hypothetical protein
MNTILLVLLTVSQVPVEGKWRLRTTYVDYGARNCTGKIHTYSFEEIGKCYPSNAKLSTLWEPRNSKLLLNGNTLTGKMYAANDTTCSGAVESTFTPAVTACTAHPNPSVLQGEKDEIVDDLPKFGKATLNYLYRTLDCTGDRILRRASPWNTLSGCLNFNVTGQISVRADFKTRKAYVYSELNCKGTETQMASSAPTCRTDMHERYNNTQSSLSVNPEDDATSFGVADSVGFLSIALLLLSSFVVF